MIHLKEHKRETENKAIETLSLPAKVCVPLSQHLGKPCLPQVKPGDKVFTGQKIGSAEAQVYSPVHSSVSGKVAAVDDWPHPVLGRFKAIIIESDGLDESVVSSPEPVSFEPDDIRGAVLEAGIVGMGGASFPTQIKLNPPKPVDSLIINGAECEPYLTADYRLMLEKAPEILRGIELIVKCLGVKNVYVAIEDNKPAAIEKFRSLVIASGRKQSDNKVVSPSSPNLLPKFKRGRVLRNDVEYKVCALKSFYPQGGEKQLIKNILKREVPQGKLPFDAGVMVHNVGTVFAVYEAVYKGKPLYERVVTVTGSCIRSPKNLLARIGAPIRDLIEACGPLKEEPAKVITGGPMMGIAQYSLDAPVIKSTNGVICLGRKEVEQLRESNCIRCGRCVEHCPVGLMPCMISMASEKERWELAKAYGCFDCMECGLCNYACPQGRNIVQQVKRAKLAAGR